jgi:hypothetical protein
VDDVRAASLGRQRRWQGRHALALAFLHARWPPSAWYERNTFLHAPHWNRPRGRGAVATPSWPSSPNKLMSSLSSSGSDLAPGAQRCSSCSDLDRVHESRDSITRDMATPSSGVASDTLLAGSGSGVVRRRARFDRRRLTANRALLRRGDDSVSLWPSCTIEESLPAAPPLKNSGATTLMNCLELSRITGSCCVGLPSSTSVDEVDAREIAGEYAAAAAAAMTWERIWPPRAQPLWNRLKQSLQVCLSITKQPSKTDGSRTTRSRCYNA